MKAVPKIQKRNDENFISWRESKKFLINCNPYNEDRMTIYKHYANYLNNRPTGDYLKVSHNSNNRIINGRKQPAFYGYKLATRIIYAANNYTCAKCGSVEGHHENCEKGRLTLHHMIPLSAKNVTDDIKTDIGNVLPLCDRCHAAEHHIPYEQFIRSWAV